MRLIAGSVLKYSAKPRPGEGRSLLVRMLGGGGQVGSGLSGAEPSGRNRAMYEGRKSSASILAKMSAVVALPRRGGPLEHPYGEPLEAID